MWAIQEHTKLKNNVCQITEDQTVVAQEVKYGRLTEEQAKTDPRNSVLLQCIGASKVVKPDYFFWKHYTKYYLYAL